MVDVQSLTEVQVLIYLAGKSGDYSNVVPELKLSLSEWQNNNDKTALDRVLLGLRSCIETSEPLLDVILFELKSGINILPNLMLLEHCADPAVVNRDLIDFLWEILETSDDGEIAEYVARALVNQLSFLARSDQNTEVGKWWKSIDSALTKTHDKRFVDAGLRTWLSCVTYLKAEQLSSTIIQESERYFELLQKYVSEASKFALQILAQSLTLINESIHNDSMKYEPKKPGVADAWSRYISLVEILGIDTSVHQTMDSLPDFAALLSPESPIPANWIISLITVGAVNSNTEGIRTLVIQLILESHAGQLTALAEHPQYVAQVLYRKFLQTPSFVFINDRCLHAERLERFTAEFMQALLNKGLANLRLFFRELAHYLLEHSHGFEAPRVLVVNAMLKVLPEQSLTSNETAPLLAAAKATLATYTSRAMADLYLTSVLKLIKSAGPKSDKEDMPDTVILEATEQLSSLSFIERNTFKQLVSAQSPTSFKLSFTRPRDATYTSFLDIMWPLQYYFLSGESLIAKSDVHKLLENALREPKTLSPKDRKLFSETVELAFDYLDYVEYDICKLAFAAFNETGTRLAALKAYKRSNPQSVAASKVINLWSHIQEATLRIIDRDLHHAFIDMLTSPDAISSSDWVDQQQICFQIVELSLSRRNLLVPLAMGLQRPRKDNHWVMPVMARIFTFIASKEYTVQLDEQVAHRFDVYAKYWGAPESEARGIAAVYLQNHKQKTHNGVLETTTDTLEQAKLHEKITGSFDNVDAHRRVLYYQILIILQDTWPRDLALDILRKARSSLENEANPPVRVHAEWLIGLIGSTHLQMEFVPFVSSAIKELDSNIGIPPRILGSLIRVCMLLYFTSKTHPLVTAQEYEKLGVDLVQQLLPLATSNKAVVRHRAISALYILSQNQMAPESMKYLVDHVAQANTTGVKGSAYQNETFLWDVCDTRLAGICGNVSSIVFDRKMPNTLLKPDFDLADLDGLDLGTFFDKPEKSSSEPDLPDLVAYREAVVREAARSGAHSNFSTHIQTKSGTFDVEYKARRTSLIVVATLCDKPVNLGAICRLSDALGVKQLIVRDVAVMEDTQFKTTALTAEKWIPIEAVPETDLHNFLRSKKSEGYTLVGIEQTDTSKILRPTLQFPEKTLLMMGHEKQGIPADILMLLDSCVEIEQLGYVRSMNIQTATAVVVHAYNQNHGPEIARLQYSPN